MAGADDVIDRRRLRLREELGDAGVRLDLDRSTSQVLGRILDELPAYDAEDEPLEEWLDDVVDRFARAA